MAKKHPPKAKPKQLLMLLVIALIASVALFAVVIMGARVGSTESTSLNAPSSEPQAADCSSIKGQQCSRNGLLGKINDNCKCIISNASCKSKTCPKGQTLTECECKEKGQECANQKGMQCSENGVTGKIAGNCKCVLDNSACKNKTCPKGELLIGCSCESVFSCQTMYASEMKCNTPEGKRGIVQPDCSCKENTNCVGFFGNSCSLPNYPYIGKIQKDCSCK